MEMIQIQRSDLDAVAGEPWSAAIVGRETIEIPHGYAEQERDEDVWRDRIAKMPKAPLFLPLNHAWLRKVDGRAFLYLQNW